MLPSLRFSLWHATLRRRVQASVILAAFLLALVPSGRASSQALRDEFYVTNSTVAATALVGNTLYIGGSFTQVGPATGGCVSINTGTGTLIPGFPKVTGSVEVVVPDGLGGWYIGGSFTAVGGLRRNNIAQILPDNTVSSWDPNANSTVYALAVSGPTIYAAGFFTSIGGQTRKSIAALDATTGQATAWNTSIIDYGYVYSLAVSGTTIYVGGDFTDIGGQARNGIAALDSMTGQATTWNPNSNAGPWAIAVSGTTVYVGGWFTSIGGQTRNRIAALDATTGQALAWNPNANSLVRTLAVSGTTVYAGGWFSSIGGQTRNRIAALDATTGHALAWNPNANNNINALAISGTAVYVGGAFTSIGGQTRNRIAALDVTTGQAMPWNPNANSIVRALAVSGTAICMGGDFTSVGGQTRNRIAALDATTGEPTAWNPNANSSVDALAVSGTTVYAGGNFTSIGGQARNNIAALDVTTGQATAWNPNANQVIYTLTIDGTTVYAGGLFTNIDGQARNYIAAIDATTGQVTPWNPNANNAVKTVAFSGTTVYAGGFFTSIGGEARSYIAALDASTGQAMSWNANPNNNVRTLALSGTVVYVGGYFTSIGGQARNHIAALDAATGQATPWNPSAVNPGYVYALAVGGANVYAGGEFTSIGGQTRNYIAAIDSATGQATTWNPDATGPAQAFAVTEAAIYLGGGFKSIGGLPQSFLAAFGTPASPAAPTNLTATILSCPPQAQLVWQDNSNNETAFEIEREINGSGDWGLVQTVPPDNQNWIDGSIEYGKTYRYRVRACSESSCSVFASSAATPVNEELRLLEGTVYATILDRGPANNPSLEPLPRVRVSVLRHGQPIFSSLPSDLDGSYGIGVVSVRCDDQIAVDLLNVVDPFNDDDDVVVEDHSGQSQANFCLDSAPVRKVFPLPSGFPVDLEWPVETYGFSGEAANIQYWNERNFADYWQDQLAMGLREPLHSIARYPAPSAWYKNCPEYYVTHFETRFAYFRSAIVHEFNHSMLHRNAGLAELPEPSHPAAGPMDEALADYFAAAWSGETEFFFRSWIAGVPVALRNIASIIPRRMPACGGQYQSIGNRYGESLVLSGALWDWRQRLINDRSVPSAQIDQAVVQALASVCAQPPLTRDFLSFREALEATGPGSEYPEDLIWAFDRHNIKDPPDDTCWHIPFLAQTRNEVIPEGREIELTWTSTPEAAAYRLYARRWPPTSIGLGLGEVVADSLMDTTYVHLEADTSAVVAFIVVVLDSLGEEGAASQETPQVTAVEEPSSPTVTNRLRVYPNPSRAGASIAFHTAAEGPVAIHVFDIAGRLVRAAPEILYPPGENIWRWDGRDDNGLGVKAGVYFFLVRTGVDTQSGKIAIIR